MGGWGREVEERKRDEERVINKERAADHTVSAYMHEEPRTMKSCPAGLASIYTSGYNVICANNMSVI